jgi:hypothetical protein
MAVTGGIEMKWILIVLIYHNGGMVEKTFDMSNETTCKLVASTIKEDIKRAIELEGYRNIPVVTTCTMVPPQD